MAWRQSPLERLVDCLRFLGRGPFLLILVLVGLAALWFVAEFLAHLVQFLDRTMFSKPW